MHSVLVGTLIAIEGCTSTSTNGQHMDLLKFALLETQVRDRSLTVHVDEILIQVEMTLPYGKGEVYLSRLKVGHLYLAHGRSIRARGGMILWVNGFTPGNLVHLRRNDGATFWPIHTLAILEMRGSKLITNRWHPPSKTLQRHPKEVQGDVRILPSEEEP